MKPGESGWDWASGIVLACWSGETHFWGKQDKCQGSGIPIVYFQLLGWSHACTRILRTEVPPPDYSTKRARWMQVYPELSFHFLIKFTLHVGLFSWGHLTHLLQKLSRVLFPYVQWFFQSSYVTACVDVILCQAGLKPCCIRDEHFLYKWDHSSYPPWFSPTFLVEVVEGRSKANIETDNILGMPQLLPKEFRRRHNWKMYRSMLML